MISSFFNRAKPINFLLITLYIGVFYWITQLYLYDTVWTVRVFFTYTGVFLGIVFSIFLANFIIRKNALCTGNSYAVLLFALFLSLFPQIFRSSEIVMANLFVLLSLRRVISIRSLLQIKQKIFDASLWVCMAALFYEWALLFLLVVFASILIYRLGDYRNWLVPLVAIFTVAVLLFTYIIWFTTGIDWFMGVFSFSLDFYSIKTSTIGFILPVALIVFFTLLSLAAFIANYKAKPSGVQNSLLLIVVALLVGVGVAAVSNNRESDEVVFALFPAAVLIANYLQLITRKWQWKESILWLFVILPVALLFIG